MNHGEGGPKRGSEFESIVYRLRDFVQHHLQGKEHAMTSGHVMNKLGFRAKRTNETFREAAGFLLREEGIPLISCSAGFYVAQTVEDLIEYLQNLEARRKGIERREAAARACRDKMLNRPKRSLFE